MQLALLAIMSTCLVIHVFGVAPQVAEERKHISGFESLKAGDAKRAKFDRLHKWSVWLVSANVLLGLGLLAVSGAAMETAKDAVKEPSQ